jgi:predicted house-cleaning noncanonical NTP pyrophosphatase (MazG superfamily)
MTEKYFHNKLIRDKVCQVIEESGGEYEAKTLSDEKYGIELKKKLLEEAKEVVKASDDELMGELGDSLQVIKSIAESRGLKLSDIEKIMEEKGEKRGEFKEKLFLIWSSQPSGK